MRIIQQPCITRPIAYGWKAVYVSVLWQAVYTRRASYTAFETSHGYLLVFFRYSLTLPSSFFFFAFRAKVKDHSFATYAERRTRIIVITKRMSVYIEANGYTSATTAIRSTMTPAIIKSTFAYIRVFALFFIWFEKLKSRKDSSSFCYKCYSVETSVFIQGEKPYMCTVCGKQFHRSDYLKLHSFSHTDERPFYCNLCGKGFKMNYNLKIHLKNHETENPLSLRDKSFNEEDHQNMESSSDLTSSEISALLLDNGQSYKIEDLRTLTFNIINEKETHETQINNLISITTENTGNPRTDLDSMNLNFTWASVFVENRCTCAIAQSIKYSCTI